MEPTVRVLLEGDAAAWLELRVESLERDPSAFGKALEEQLQIPPELAALRFRDVAEGGFHLGAFADEKLIGMATFFRATGLKERHKGNIYGVYVTSQQRGKGVGRALITTLLTMARRDSSLEQILLAVASGQTAAKRLYRSFGFETYGTEPNALKMGSTYVDEDHMILRIR